MEKSVRPWRSPGGRGRSVGSADRACLSRKMRDGERPPTFFVLEVHNKSGVDRRDGEGSRHLHPYDQTRDVELRVGTPLSSRLGAAFPLPRQEGVVQAHALMHLLTPLKSRSSCTVPSWALKSSLRGFLRIAYVSPKSLSSVETRG